VLIRNRKFLFVGSIFIIKIKVSKRKILTKISCEV